MEKIPSIKFPAPPLSTAAQPPPNFSPQDVDLLLDDFSSSDLSRRLRWLPPSSSSPSPTLYLLDHLLLPSLLRRDFPSNLKPLLLLVLEDHLPSLPLSPSPIPTLLNSLRYLLSSQDPIKDQFLLSTTSIAISILDSAVPEDFSHLQTLIGLLLTFVNRPNHGPDRQTRSLACISLRELEVSFPGLLSGTVGHIFSLAQAERTHAAQSYALLLATVSKHVVRLGLLAGTSSFLSTSVPLSPFSAPQGFGETERVRSMLQPPSEINLREIRRVLDFLLRRPQELTAASAMELMAELTNISTELEMWIPSVVPLLKLQFSGFIRCSDSVLSHVVLVMSSCFSEALTVDDESRVACRLMLIATERHQPLAFRLLALHWLMGSSRLSAHVGGFVDLLHPNLFDPLALKAKKTDVLVTVLARKVKHGINEDEVMRFVEDNLVCLNAFKWLPPWSSETSVTFRMLNKLLISIAPHDCGSSEQSNFHGLRESNIMKTLQSMLVKLALEHRRVLVPVIANFVDRLLGCEAHQRVGQWLLKNINESLLSNLEPGYQLSPYYLLFEKIAQNNTVPPPCLINFLTRQMVSLTEKHGPDTELRSWSHGTKVLSICHVLLKQHSSSRIFLPLSRLLVFTCQSFPDLDVRDTARIYLRMLSCIPGKKLRHIIVTGEQSYGISPSPLSGYSPHSAPDIKNLSGVATYIHLERVIPLLVKQSWSLALPNFTMCSNGAISAGGILDISSPSIPLVERKEGTMEDARVQGITSQTEVFGMVDPEAAEISQVLHKYFACIPDYRHMPGIKISVPCMLRFESEPFVRDWGSPSSASSSEDSDNFPGLYAVTLVFSSKSKFGTIPVCRVPFLLGEPSKSTLEIIHTDNYFLEDSFHASVVMQLEPQEPMPGLVHVSLKANTDNGQVISDSLQSISVGIEDMFLKVSTPPVVPAEETAEFLNTLFHALWAACAGSTKMGRKTFLLSGGKGSVAINGTESVKLLEVPATFLIVAVERYLAAFVVCVTGNVLVDIVRKKGVISDVVWEGDNTDISAGDISDSGALVPFSSNNSTQLQLFEDDIDEENIVHQSRRNIGAFHVMIFLPPRYHLLFLMEVSHASTLVRIRTDYWPCLACIDEYLEALISYSEKVPQN